MMIDLTGVASATIAAVFPVISGYAIYFIQTHMKDKQAAAVLGEAVKNSIGELQQAAQGAIGPFPPIPGVPDHLVPAVAYVMTQATPELARFPEITPEAIAQKVSAQIGLSNIASNIATAASPAPSPPPLAAVPPAAMQTLDVVGGNAGGGGRGYSVSDIQNLLRDAGFDPGAVDGVWGAGSMRAMRAFQQKNNLAPTGTLNAETSRLLFSP